MTAVVDPGVLPASAQDVAAMLRSRLGTTTPKVALVLGSGLGALATEIEGATVAVARARQAASSRE